MKNDSAKVTVVIPTRNRKDDLEKCIKSLMMQCHLPYEIITVDDASTDDTKKICEKYSTKYIRNAKRRGPSFGKNIGIMKADTELIAFIDDDCIAEKYWLKNLVEIIVFNESSAIVGGRISNLSGGLDNLKEIRIKHTTINIILNILHIKSDAVGKIHQNGFVDSNFDKECYKGEVDWVSAGNMIINKSLLNSVYFDESLKGNSRFEEPDFCIRAKKHGAKIIYTPDALVYHKFSSLNRADRFDDLYFRKRNQLYIILKNGLPFSSIFSFINFIIVHSFDIIAYILLSFKDRRYIRGVFGKIDGLKDYIDVPKKD